MPDNGTSAPSTDLEEAERLKALGNAAYSKGNNDEAYRLYSEAIEKDPSNAIYYANRAAALLGQKKYLAAIRDCEKAVETDPAYFKACQRLGTAAQKAIDAYGRALKSFPQILSPADRALKQKCNLALSQAKAQSRKMPWEMAKALTDKKAEKVASCVFILNSANFDFEAGMTILDKREIKGNDAMMMMMQQTGVLMHLSSAILNDHRVFRVKDEGFFKNMATQLICENAVVGGWASAGGPAAVKERFLSGVRKGSWDAVRRANEATIRSWIWNAFAYMVKNPEQGKYTFDSLTVLARNIIEDVDKDLPLLDSRHRKDGNFQSNWYYSKAHAQATIAWCLKQQSDSCTPDDPAKESKLKSAAQYYKLAAEGVADDDFFFSDNMREHLGCLIALKTPLRQTLPICKHIRSALPEALEIWGNAAVGARLRKNLDEVTDFEEKYTKMIADGRCTLDEVGELEPMEHVNLVDKASVPAADEPPKAKAKGPDERRAKMKDLLKKI